MGWAGRWDSVRLNTPSRTLGLPGMRYDDADLDGFRNKEEVNAFLEEYARSCARPVLRETRVVSLTKSGDEFLVRTHHSTIRARAVVLAPGEYTLPHFLKFLGELPVTIDSIHSCQDRSPQALNPGAIQVVGGAGSPEPRSLRTCTRPEADRPSTIRRLRGKDFMEWWDMRGIRQRLHAAPREVE
ncbi:hypothetical protein NITHO_1560009 [Nitrolancea hollandica Lb]|uniref:FAD dependent oxidoreductase n=1 Tax=Nitrolancea hollandica Lb TaxID=1129897 RepID=I4EDL9_9BACT|nr:hypothetical protein NITHO_1560009 [Nitrolancea hollandica Lb]